MAPWLNGRQSVVRAASNYAVHEGPAKISEPASTAQHALSDAPDALGRPLAAFTPNFPLLAPSRPSDGPSDRLDHHTD